MLIRIPNMMMQSGDSKNLQEFNGLRILQKNWGYRIFLPLKGKPEGFSIYFVNLVHKGGKPYAEVLYQNMENLTKDRPELNPAFHAPYYRIGQIKMKEDA